jgi:hypothetical protein
LRLKRTAERYRRLKYNALHTSTTEPGVRATGRYGLRLKFWLGPYSLIEVWSGYLHLCGTATYVKHLAKYRGGIPRAAWSVSARRVIFHLLHRSGPERETDFVAAGIAGGGALERGSGASLGPDVTLDETLDETLGADEPRARAGSAATA